MSGRPSKGSGAGGDRRAAAPLGHARFVSARRIPELPQDWEDGLYLALDVETTGLDPKSCRVVEIGAVLFTPSRGLEDAKAIDILIDPGMPIPALASSIHGIRDRDVAGSPSFAEIAGDLVAMASGAILVAHNAAFDMGFVGMELECAGRPVLGNAVLDSLHFARAAFPGLPSYSLPKLVAALGIETSRSHRALEDALASARVFMKCARKLAAHRPA